MSMYHVTTTNELYHHGILGQKWGIRRYQNPDGTLTEEGKKRYANGNYSESRAAREMAQKDRRELMGTVAGGSMAISTAIAANTVLTSAAMAPTIALGASICPALLPLIPAVLLGEVAVSAGIGKSFTQSIMKGAQSMDNALSNRIEQHKNKNTE